MLILVLLLQAGRLPGYVEKAKTDAAAMQDRWSDRHQMDRFDHIWGLVITHAGAWASCTGAAYIMIKPWSNQGTLCHTAPGVCMHLQTAYAILC